MTPIIDIHADGMLLVYEKDLIYLLAFCTSIVLVIKKKKTNKSNNSKIRNKSDMKKSNLMKRIRSNFNFT